MEQDYCQNLFSTTFVVVYISSSRVEILCSTLNSTKNILNVRQRLHNLKGSKPDPDLLCCVKVTGNDLE